MVTAFVLAAGLGTRLRPLTEHRPKPLVPVCGVPMLAYALAACRRFGLTDVIVNAHWLADQIEAWSGEREGVRVSVSTERPDVLGTGGGLKRVADRLADRFAVLNADVLHDVDLRTLIDAVPDGGAAMALRRDPEHAPRYGVVAADAAGRVVELTTVASAPATGAVDRSTHFTGIHAMDRAALELVPDGFACVVRTAYRKLVAERRVAGIVAEGPWLDAGDPEAYLDANLTVLRGEARVGLDPFARAGYAITADGREYGDRSLVARAAHVEGPVWIGPDATIGRDASLARAIVGPGGYVASGAALDEVVVWDGERAEGTLRRAIVHPGGALACGG